MNLQLLEPIYHSKLGYNYFFFALGEINMRSNDWKFLISSDMYLGMLANTYAIFTSLYGKSSTSVREILDNSRGQTLLFQLYLDMKNNGRFVTLNNFRIAERILIRLGVKSSYMDDANLDRLFSNLIKLGLVKSHKKINDQYHEVEKNGDKSSYVIDTLSETFSNFYEQLQKDDLSDLYVNVPSGHNGKDVNSRIKCTIDAFKLLYQYDISKKFEELEKISSERTSLYNHLVTIPLVGIVRKIPDQKFLYIIAFLKYQTNKELDDISNELRGYIQTVFSKDLKILRFLKELSYIRGKRDGTGCYVSPLFVQNKKNKEVCIFLSIGFSRDLISKEKFALSPFHEIEKNTKSLKDLETRFTRFDIFKISFEEGVNENG